MTTALPTTTTKNDVVLDDETMMKEAEELDGYFSDTPLVPQVHYPIHNEYQVHILHYFVFSQLQSFRYSNLATWNF
jgi:hypothetical protein